MIKRLLVAIPNYNNARYIKETIDSVYIQEFRCEDFTLSIEVVVFDNSSTDNSLDVLKDYENITIIVNDKNIGAIANHNKCIEYAISERYDYLKILSSDDVLVQGALLLQAKLLYEMNVSFVTCDMYITNEELKQERSYQFFSGDDSGLCMFREIQNLCFEKCDNLIGGPSNLLVDVASIGGVRYPENYKWVSDLAFALKLLNNGCYYNVREALFYYRRHDSTDSGNLNCKYLRNKEILFLMWERKQYYWIAHRVIKYIRKLFGRNNA
ncbi:TPA: glycosyltransferase family 2 protein [Vibrio cholerae]